MQYLRTAVLLGDGFHLIKANVMRVTDLFRVNSDILKINIPMSYMQQKDFPIPGHKLSGRIHIRSPRVLRDRNVKPIHQLLETYFKIINAPFDFSPKIRTSK